MELSEWMRAIRAYWGIQRKRKKSQRLPLREHARYLRDYVRAARQIAAAETAARLVMHPRLSERTSQTPFDAHYFYQDVWAFRRIVERCPVQHVDIGSRAILIGLLSCLVPVEFVDIRPLAASLPHLTNKKGDLLGLAYDSQSLDSLSCLHVAEHVGLGRYGDPIDILDGTRRACAELQRVLKPGGHLYFSLPLAGENRIEFNGHRVHTVERMLSYFPELTLLELSGVTDQAEFMENITPDELNRQTYACGLFLFTR